MDRQLIVYNDEKEDHKTYSLYIPLHFWFKDPPLIDITLIQYSLPKIQISKEITIKYPVKLFQKYRDQKDIKKI